MTVFKEDFSAYELGDLDGQGGWVKQSGTFTVVDHDSIRMVSAIGDSAYYKVLDPPIFGKRYYGYSSVYPGRDYFDVNAFFGSNDYCRDHHKGWGTYQNRGSPDYQIYAMNAGNPKIVYNDSYNDAYFTTTEYDFNTTEYKYLKSYHPDAELDHSPMDQDYDGMLSTLQTSGLHYAIIDTNLVTGSETDATLIAEFGIESYGKLYNRFPKWKQTKLGMRPTY